MRILVLTCDKYSEAWVPFFTFFQRHWPDCPYPIDMATDLELTPEMADRFLWTHVNVFSAGRVGWNRVLKDYLDRHIAENGNEPVMVFLEDYFLTAKPILELIEEAQLVLKTGLEATPFEMVGNVRLYPCPGGDVKMMNSPFWLVDRKAKYRTSLQVGVWDPQFLRQLTVLTRSPWDFEMSGTIISRSLRHNIYAFDRLIQPWPIEYICTAIVRGKWQQSALDYCAKNGVPVTPDKLGIDDK